MKWLTSSPRTPMALPKTKLAVELFGKAGADLIPTLNAGGGSLDEYDAIAKEALAPGLL